MEYARITSSFYSRSYVSLIAVFIPYGLGALNILALNNTAIAIITFALILLTSGKVISRIVFKNRSLRLEDHILSVMIFLTLVCIIIAPFVIFSNFTPTYSGALYLVTGIIVSVLYSKFHLSLAPKITFPSWKLSKREILLLSLLAAAFISDFVVLASSRSDSYTWIWAKIPQDHFVLLFVSTALALVSVAYSKMPNSAKLVIIIAHSILVESYISLVIATLPGGDNWYMLGEIYGSISGTTTFERISEPITQIGDIAIPSVFISGWAKGFANSLVIFITNALQIDAYYLFPWVSPIFFGIFGKTVVYRIGKLVSHDERYPLMIALSLSLGVFLLFFEASTTKLSIGLTFFLFGMYLWMRYIVAPSRRNLAIAMAFLAASIMNYSLFFLCLLITAAISVVLIKLKESSQTKVISLTKVGVIALITISSSLVVPVIDTFEQTEINWSNLWLLLPTNIQDALNIRSGFLEPPSSLGAKSTLPADNILVNNTGWSIVSIFLWLLTVIGLLNWKKFNRNIYFLLLWFTLIVHISWYIVLYASEGVKPVGSYLFIVTELVRIPFIAMGITWIFNFLKIRHAQLTVNRSQQPSAYAYKIPNPAIKIAPILALLLVSLSVVSLQTVETRFTNVAQGDVDAAKYIASTDENYVVITDLFASGPLYSFSKGLVNAGGFYVEYIPGVNIDVRTDQLLGELTRTDDVIGVMNMAAKESNTCRLYVLIPSYISLSEPEIKRFEDNLGPYIGFGDKTKVFTYDACK